MDKLTLIHFQKSKTNSQHFQRQYLVKAMNKILCCFNCTVVNMYKPPLHLVWKQFNRHVFTQHNIPFRDDSIGRNKCTVLQHGTVIYHYSLPRPERKFQSTWTFILQCHMRWSWWEWVMSIYCTGTVTDYQIFLWLWINFIISYNVHVLYNKLTSLTMHTVHLHFTPTLLFQYSNLLVVMLTFFFCHQTNQSTAIKGLELSTRKNIKSNFAYTRVACSYRISAFRQQLNAKGFKSYICFHRPKSRVSESACFIHSMQSTGDTCICIQRTSGYQCRNTKWHWLSSFPSLNILWTVIPKYRTRSNWYLGGVEGVLILNAIVFCFLPCLGEFTSHCWIPREQFLLHCWLV